jgi:hypothetical protein
MISVGARLAVQETRALQTPRRLLIVDFTTMQERLMKTYRWLTLGAALVITALEVWVFTGASSAAASQVDAPTPVMMGTADSGDAP